MNKRLVRSIGGTIFLLVLVFAVILVYDNDLYKHEGLNSPGLFSSYSDRGYYKIDPETILATLDGGRTDVFTPLLENPDEIQGETDMPIHWTQADFLKIANTLGQFLWNDTMGLRDWDVNYVHLEGSCDEPTGFHFASITYFKTRATLYDTRLIEIDPKSGWVRWGDGGTYPKPIMHGWKSVDLLGAKITADDALRIASEDAKKRFQFKDYCDVFMGTPQYNDSQNWYLDFMGTPGAITYIVNLDTGNFTFQKPNK